MSWLLDTNTCSYVLKRRFGLAEQLQARSPADLHVCSITLAEARTGALRSMNPTRLLAAWDYFLEPFDDRFCLSTRTRLMPTPTSELIWKAGEA